VPLKVLAHDPQQMVLTITITRAAAKVWGTNIEKALSVDGNRG
jgi:hypothetical protein